MQLDAAAVVEGGAVEEYRYAGLQQRERNVVAAVQRERFDLRFRHQPRERRRAEIDERRSADHFHCVRCRPDVQRDGHARLLADGQHDACLDVWTEALKRGTHRVGPRRQPRQRERAAGIRRRGTLGPGGFVRERHVRSRQNRASRVCNGRPSPSPM